VVSSVSDSSPSSGLSASVTTPRRNASTAPDRQLPRSVSAQSAPGGAGGLPCAGTDPPQAPADAVVDVGIDAVAWAVAEPVVESVAESVLELTVCVAGVATAAPVRLPGPVNATSAASTRNAASVGGASRRRARRRLSSGVVEAGGVGDCVMGWVGMVRPRRCF
jgi:hypothetical protein